jgi:hypothetical protein
VERQPGGSSKVHNSVHALRNFTRTYMCTLEPLLISVSNATLLTLTDLLHYLLTSLNLFRDVPSIRVLKRERER